jgi:hybrid cluster-associated redox disulfide protein
LNPHKNIKSKRGNFIETLTTDYRKLITGKWSYLRLSKEEFCVCVYCWHMNEETQIQSHWTVEEVLRRKPKTAHVFVKNRTQCVGCYLQKFCTMQDVAEIYQLNLKKILKDLNNYKKGE